MKFSVDWVDDASNAAPEEAATVAAMRIWLADQNVTAHLLDKVAADHVTVALYGIAHGLTHDWWTLFGGRDRGLSLMQFRSGFVVPDIRMSFDGAAFEVFAQQHAYRGEGARFWAGPSETMSRREAEAVLGDLIDKILERLDSRNLGQTSAALRWARVCESRNSSEAGFCEAAGALGLDPYAIDEASAAMIERAESLFEGEALTEFMSGARNTSKEKLIDWVEYTKSRASYKSYVPELKDTAYEIQRDIPARISEPAWALGYRRARAMRKLRGIETRHRYRSFRDLAKIFGTSNAYAIAGKTDGIRALRSDEINGSHIHLRYHGHSDEARTAYLFTFARAVGDVTCFADAGLAPINDLRLAHRQATGRAFAAEFLAPIDEIESMIEDGRDNISIAEEFSVSTTVIERQIENRLRIAEACR